MLRNFLGIIVVIGILITLVSQGDNVLHWGKNIFKSQEVVEPIKEKSDEDIDTSKTESLAEVETSEVLEESVAPEELKEPEIEEEISTEKIISGVVDKGDTVIELLDDYDSPNRVRALIKAAEDVFSPKKFRIGQPYIITYDIEKNTIIKFEYEIDKFEKLIIEGEEPKAYIEAIVYDRKLALVQNSIENNLFLSVDEMGETPQLAMRIADIFAWEINFIRDIQENDSFAILVEKLYRDGEFKGYGRAIGATFTNKDKEYSAFLFYDNKKIENYYSDKGENLKKVLLQSPLSFTRVTSGYTKSRKHPIFGDYRPHLGIDYGAPKGTPIMAVGSGTVKVRGWVGGYGYQVVISHSAGFESMYSHLSGFARGIKKGTKVRQGQTIGFVGSTGISTGPHLDFRLKRYGKFINPASAMSPRGEPISKKDKQAFEQWTKTVHEFMDGVRPLDSYTTDMLKPST